MDKLIKAHKDYYQYKNHQHEFFKVVSRTDNTIMLMTDEYDCCLICDVQFNILHEITIGTGGAFPSMSFVS